VRLGGHAWRPLGRLTRLTALRCVALILLFVGGGLAFKSPSSTMK